MGGSITGGRYTMSSVPVRRTASARTFSISPARVGELLGKRVDLVLLREDAEHAGQVDALALGEFLNQPYPIDVALRGAAGARAR